MPHLECVNEEFKHYFIVDTPPRGKRPELAIESGFCSKPKSNPKKIKIKCNVIYLKLKTLLNSFLVVIV